MMNNHELQLKKYSNLNSQELLNNPLMAETATKTRQGGNKKTMHPHIQFITLNKHSKANSDKLNFNNTRQTQVQIQGISHRSSSRLMENMIDGSAIKQIYRAEKSFLDKQNMYNHSNYGGQVVHSQPDYIEDYNKSNLQKDYGQLDKFIRSSLQEQRTGQLLHQRLSNLSSQHQYDAQQGVTGNKNLTLEQEQPVDYSQEQDTENEQDYLEMVIQLDSETSIPLRIHNYDDPLLLSRQFCYSNNIDPKVISILAKQIKQLQYKSLSKPQSSYNSHTNSINKYNRHQNSQNKMHQKQNKQYLSNTNTTKQKLRNNSKGKQNVPHKNSSEQVQPFDPRTKFNTLNNTQNKNSKNNTTLISNHENNYGELYISNIEDSSHPHNVFNRLYINSQAKAKKRVLERNKQKSLQSQVQLRNYQSSAHSVSYINHSDQNNSLIDNAKQANLNQSTTYINNLSNSNINNSLANLHYSRSKNNYHNNNKNLFIQAKIYEKNVQLQRETAKKNQNIKEELKAMQERQYTRHPEINPLSKLIVQKLRQMDNYQQQDKENNLKNSHIRLFEQKSKSKQKKIAKTIDHLKKKQQQQMKQCTFHPKILKKSQCQVVNTERFLLLHEDYYVRENKAQTVKAAESKKTFERRHPQINQVSKRLMKDKPFAERMTQYKINAQRNKQKLEKQVYSVQKHRPQINKSSKNHKRENISIGEYLYSKSLEKKSKNNQSQIDLRKSSTNKLSQNMYNQMKKNAFRYMFTLMDSDEDGFISALKINILGLETQVLHLLAPLLCEMQQVQIELDEQQFVQSLQRLFNTFTIYEKNLIINVYKNPLRKESKCNNQSSFHPSLNEKSIQMARQIRDNGVCLYQLGKQKQMQKQAKLNELRALKALIQIQQCTFHPNLIYHH